MNVIPLSSLDLFFASLLVLMLAGLSIFMQLRIGKAILIAAVRTAVQLTLLGVVLKVLFASVDWRWVLLMSLVMFLGAAREVRARQKRFFSGKWGFGIGMVSMFLSSFTVAIFALIALVGPEPWYTPRYAIPMLGMLLGNTMTGVSLAMNTLTQEAWQNSAVIEERLLMGESSKEVMADYRRESIRIALTPIMNSMVAAGIISLPGMMTGQILAGSPPFEAAKYQILIMFLIASGTGFGAMMSVWLTSKRLFDERHRLRLDRLQKYRG